MFLVLHVVITFYVYVIFHCWHILDFDYPLISRWTFGFFFFTYLDIMNNAICVQALVCVYVFIFLEYMPKSGIAELNGNSLFNHLRNCQAVFHSGVTL